MVLKKGLSQGALSGTFSSLSHSVSTVTSSSSGDVTSTGSSHTPPHGGGVHFLSLRHVLLILPCPSSNAPRFPTGAGDADHLPGLESESPQHRQLGNKHNCYEQLREQRPAVLQKVSMILWNRLCCCATPRAVPSGGPSLFWGSCVSNSRSRQNAPNCLVFNWLHYALYLSKRENGKQCTWLHVRSVSKEVIHEHFCSLGILLLCCVQTSCSAHSNTHAR